MEEKPFNKILIANRGEIAVRIIRTAKELGIKTVAIYSSADENSLHKILADEAYLVGGPEPKDSYLNIESIISIAKKAEVEAIHPGYGFLSQVPEFVKRVEEEGIVFIGPSEKVQKVTGDKIGARKLMHDNGVPVIPGTLSPIKDLDEAVDVAEKLGYPVIVKPVIGGGGIGMQVCWSKEQLTSAIERAMKLASSAFGRADVYIEKYFPKAKHIEVQILADKYGNVIHLFERECSIQRRFQKLLEESPSPILDEEKREKVTKLAIKVAKLVEYVNAGTVEFLYVPDIDEFFFLEVNSRIQVEHPVTEMITGVDIVEEQFWIAAGYRLRYSQNEIERKGHAIEVRINAEDPYNNFTPSPGTIEQYLPPSGVGIRVDSGVYQGYTIPPYYDPLIIKLIVWAPNREKAIRRMRRALDEFIIKGISTNIPLHKVILDDEVFREGTYTTRFIYERNIVERLKKTHYKGIELPIKYPVKREVKESVSKEIIIQPVSAWILSGRFELETFPDYSNKWRLRSKRKEVSL